MGFNLTDRSDLNNPLDRAGGAWKACAWLCGRVGMEQVAGWRGGVKAELRLVTTQFQPAIALAIVTSGGIFLKCLFSLAYPVSAAVRVADNVLSSDERKATNEPLARFLILFLGSPESSLVPCLVAIPPQIPHLQRTPLFVC